MAGTIEATYESIGKRDPEWTWADKHFINPRIVAMYKTWISVERPSTYVSVDGRSIGRFDVTGAMSDHPCVAISLASPMMNMWEQITGISSLSRYFIEGFSWEDLAAAHVYGLDIPVVGVDPQHPLIKHAKIIEMSERMLEPRVLFTESRREAMSRNNQEYAVYWPENGLDYRTGTDLYEALVVMRDSTKACELWTCDDREQDFDTAKVLKIRSHQDR